MKIAIDRHIPFIEGVFEPYGAEVTYSERIDPAGADALVIRTRTRCDKSFLKGHQPKIIATATIGFDHIDTIYCKEHGIEIATAAGCNARGVAQWVFAALIALGVKEPQGCTLEAKEPQGCTLEAKEPQGYTLEAKEPQEQALGVKEPQGLTRGVKEPQGLTLGVVGVGNVGSIVAEVAASCGFKVMKCDPPKSALFNQSNCNEYSKNPYVSLDELLEKSDIVSLHVPLNEQTACMASHEFFERMRDRAIFLNSSRGEVIDESALINSKISRIALDVWRNEPNINLDLLKKVTIATPHIAGYSLQGKAMGTAMSVRSVAKALGIKALENWYPTQVTPTTPKPDISWNELCDTMPSCYDIMADDARLRNTASDFEKLRSHYNYRQEFF